MKKSTRKSFFYFLLVLFALAAPLAIAYSLGYSYDFSRARIRQNGGIFIKSRITQSSVFLDGAFVKKTGLIMGSTLLTDVSPSSHLVRLERQGYRPWSKLVRVEPSAVTELRSVVLIPYPAGQATTTPNEFVRARSSLPAPTGYSKTKTGNLVRDDGNGTKIIARNVHSYGAQGNTVVFVDKNGFLARYDSASETTDTISRPGFYLDAGALKFFSSPSGIFMAIVDPSGGLFLFNDATKEVKPVEGGVRSVSFDRDEEKLLIRRDQGIDLLWLSDNRFQPFQKAGARETIFSAQEQIKDAAWFYGDSAHVAFQTGDGIFFTEIDGRGGRNTVQLASGVVSGLTTSPALPTAIFFKKGKTPYKIEL